jgi:2-polyprenyl-3-methyl-5-hydroxy-6-metoxy-1,4-benzoquinol methylase
MTDRIQDQWEQLGKSDPYWAVLTNPRMKGGKWDPAAFFATGEQELNSVLQRIKQAGGDLNTDSALDFGCGVGRLSRALAKRFRQITAVDVSTSMLAEARRANQHIDNIAFIHNTATDLSIILDNSIDFVLTSKVLQHMPKDRQQEYIREFCRILRPQGIISMQTQSRVNFFSRKGWVYLLAGNHGLHIVHRWRTGTPGIMNVYPIPRRTVLATLQQEGLNIIHTRQSPRRRYALIHHWYIAQKP